MSLPIEHQVAWTDLLTHNKPLVSAIIGEALSMMPEYPEGASIEQTALLARERKGYEEAMENLFSKIPKDRIVQVSSKFMDMST